MEVAFKDVVAVGSLIVSAAAFVYSSEAKKKTQELNELVFRAETVSQLLKEVHVNTSGAIEPEDRTASCLYAGSLAKAEALFVKDASNRLVGQLFIDQVERGLLPQNCVVETLESLPVEQVKEAAEVAELVDRQSLDDIEMGEFHALVASYSTTSAGCAHAKSDVAEFVELLRGKGVEGSSIYVARTLKSNSYAVTIDAGDDRALAFEISGKIKEVSALAFGKTGHDSFVQINSDWYIDANCSMHHIIDG